MNALQRIFERKRDEVLQAMQREPLEAVRAAAFSADPPRGFLCALEQDAAPLALIAEVKKASPSRGLIRPDFDPAEVASSYARAGAQGLSVLTDEHYFQGSRENLEIARRVTALPCLRKDFISDPYQVYQSRAWGADAILLIVASLEDALLKDLLCLAHDLGMDALVEVHDENEADRALASGARLIGVNNRSLADFSTDLATGERILPKLGGVFAVAESAIETHEDVLRMKAAGAKGVLIGTTFCAAHDIEDKVREVMNWTQPDNPITR